MFKGGNACENEAGLKTEGNLGIWGGKDYCSPWSNSKAFGYMRRESTVSLAISLWKWRP